MKVYEYKGVPNVMKRKIGPREDAKAEIASPCVKTKENRDEESKTV